MKIVKSFYKLMASFELMAILLLAFAASCAIATFIENDFGVETSWAIVYNAHWFEAIQVLLGINLLLNIFRFKMWKKRTIPAFIFHLGMLFILVGSGITRYMGFEGILHIREGKQNDTVLTYTPYIQVRAFKDNKMYSIEKPKLMSKISKNLLNMKMNIDGDIANIKLKSYIPNAITKIVDDPNGKAIITMVITTSSKPQEYILRDKDIKEFDKLTIALNPKIKNLPGNYIKIYTKDDKFYIVSNKKIEWFSMAENKNGTIKENKEAIFKPKRLYSVSGVNIVPKDMKAKAIEKLVIDNTTSLKSSTKLSAIVLNVNFKGKTKEVTLRGMGRGTKGFVVKENIAGVDFEFEWGSKLKKLPFSLYLKDFQLERYPGSMSPSSYASEVVVLDKVRGVELPYRIYMNHVLDYGGYRFFQSSYDMDEKGTVLSVNKDPGKWPTYIGYILLGVGFLLNILNPKSRFRVLSSKITKEMQKSSQVATLFIATFFTLFVQNANAVTYNQNDLINIAKKYDKIHCENFATILVQSNDGRIMPIDTISDEVLNKVSKTTSLYDLTPNQVIVGMMTNPTLWQNIKMIKVFHPKLKKILNMQENEKYAAFNDFFKDTKYILAQYAETANRKKPANRDKFDKDVLKVDERLNISYMVYSGSIFRMFPKLNDKNKKWYDTRAAISTFPKDQSTKIRKILNEYFTGVEEGIKHNNWIKANNAIEKIKAYQKEYGADIIPPKQRIEAEIFFNKAKIFQKLTPIYLLAGLLLLGFIFAKMIKPTIGVNLVTKFVFWINVLAFMAHTFGLALRWYVAGHAPWSDGYESMLYISWAIILSGVIFSKQSILSLALTSILAGVTLFVAHLSWMDPQITNLVPVLKSYWLNIHVSVITASYGFLGLCSLLGFFTLILFILRNPNNKKRDENFIRNITEATRINEMSMILGLSLLTLGNFLGGVWANESWGRYWGWDPKETWALVSILVYATVVHLRFIPKLNSQYAFAVASLLAYSSIIMTYFGVNFYLSGMHSYASGDPVPIPTFVYYTIAVVFVTILLAYPKRTKLKL